MFSLLPGVGRYTTKQIVIKKNKQTNKQTNKQVVDSYNVESFLCLVYYQVSGGIQQNR